MLTPDIQATTAQFPGYSFQEACALIAAGVSEGFGAVRMDHVQLCPQAPDVVDEACVDFLRQKYPHTQFRLHANVRVDDTLRILDASRYSKSTRWYYKRLAQLSLLLDAQGYSLHAGYRQDASLQQMKANVLAIQAFFPCDVLVEGLYPDQRKDWLVKTWEEYRWLMESGLFYAIDLSHLNILKQRVRYVDLGLVRALLLHPNCKEVHLSHNYGNQDSHLQLKSKFYEQAWWREVWLQTMSERIQIGLEHPIHFTEGRAAQRSPRRRERTAKNNPLPRAKIHCDTNVARCSEWQWKD